MRAVLAGVGLCLCITGIMFGMVHTIGGFPTFCFVAGAVFGTMAGMLIAVGLWTPRLPPW